MDDDTHSGTGGPGGEPTGQAAFGWGQVLGGVVIGFGISWMSPFLAAVVFADTRREELVAGVTALVLVPVVALLFLLWRIVTRSRQARPGAIGLLLGVTVGAVIGAGTCIPIWTTPV